jgi:YHS domain-containing protein
MGVSGQSSFTLRLFMKLFFRAFLLAAIALLLAGCTVYNTTSDGNTKNLMLKGHDPLSYFAGAAPVPGKAEFTASHEHGTYYFASAENRDKFKAEPAKFAPQYGGFCSNGAAYAIKLGGLHDVYRVVDGKLYMFGDPTSRDYWGMDVKGLIAHGDKYWKDEMKDTSARWQSIKRLVLRVPHYKSGKQLADEYAAWKAKQPAAKP